MADRMEIERIIERKLREEYGLVNWHRISGIPDDLGGGDPGDPGEPYELVIGDGSSTSFAITHGKGEGVVCAVYQNAAPYAQVLPNVLATNANTITLTFSSPPPTDSLKAVVK